jgi:hypothetical protein
MKFIIPPRGSKVDQGRYITPFMVVDYLCQQFPDCDVMWDKSMVLRGWVFGIRHEERVVGVRVDPRELRARPIDVVLGRRMLHTLRQQLFPINHTPPFPPDDCSPANVLG